MEITRNKQWDIVSDYLLDNIMEFENYFERQKQFDHINSSIISPYPYDALEEFKMEFLNLYLK